MNDDWAFFLRQGWIPAAEIFLRSGEEKEFFLGELLVKVTPRTNHSAYISRNLLGHWTPSHGVGSAEGLVDYLISLTDALPQDERIQALDAFFNDYLPE